MQSTKEIAAEIRKVFKKTLLGTKWSIRIQTFSGGSSISITLREAPYQVLEAKQIHPYMQRGYSQLSEYTLDDYDSEERISNGAVLTPAGWKLFCDVVKFLDSLNWFNVRDSFLHLQIGDWDRPFKVV